MNRKHTRYAASHSNHLFANSEIAVITGFSVVVGTALLIMMVMAIGFTSALIQQVTTGAL